MCVGERMSVGAHVCMCVCVCVCGVCVGVWVGVCHCYDFLCRVILNIKCMKQMLDMETILLKV